MTHRLLHPFSGQFVENLVGVCKICSKHVFEVRVCDEDNRFQKTLAITDDFANEDSHGAGCQLFKDHLKQHALMRIFQIEKKCIFCE